MHIQILKIYQESFHNVRQHTLEWFKVAFAPLLLYVIATISGFSFVFTGEDPMAFGLGSFIHGVLTFISAYSLVIKGYQYAFLGKGSDRWWDLQLNMRFVKLVLYSWLIGFLAILLFAIVGGIVFGAHMLLGSIAFDIALGLILTIGVFYLGMRVALLFALVCTDHSESLRLSWRLMEGHVWRFFWLCVLIALTAAIISGIGMGFLALLIMGGPFLASLAVVLMFCFGLFMWFVYWAALSKAYALVYQSLTSEKAS